MQITIINDCCDENARLRQVSRVGSLIKNSSVNCFGVRSETEAAGFFVDAIDAFEGREGVVLVNVAPRGGKGKKWENGTPFGYFWHKKTLIVSSVDGFVLSLAKKLEIIKEFYLVDIAEVLNSISEDELGKEIKDRIIKSQFRSFDFLPRLAAWVWKKRKIPAEKYNLAEIADIPNCIWFIDNFGNIKTTLLKKDCDFSGKTASLKIGSNRHKLNFYDRLKDLPDKETGLAVGSSGTGDKRFLEIMRQGGNAAKALGIKLNDKIVMALPSNP